MDLDWWSTVLLAALATWLLWKYFTWTYGYWQRLGVPCPEPSVLFGNMKEAILAQKHQVDVIDDIYRKMEGHPFCGIYRAREPMLLVRDAELLRTMVVRDFPSFHDNNFYVNEELDPLFARNIFFMKGEKWRKMRSQLSPSFTASRLKPMFLLIKEVCDDLVRVLQKEGPKGEIEARELCLRYTTDVVSSCAMGVKGDALDNKESAMLLQLRKIFSPETTTSFTLMLATMFPFLASLFRFRMLPVEVHRFLFDVVSQTVARREQKGEHRNDYLEMLMELKEKGYLDSSGQVLADRNFFTDLDIAAQVMTFIGDGIQTSSANMSFVLYELALNPEVQQKLRQELQEVVSRHDGQLCYEAITDATYLDMVVTEAMRLHPSVGHLEKTCTAAYPLTTPSGRTFTLQPGATIIMPISAIQHDPLYYPNPHVFDPERFSPDVKDRTAKQAFLTFGAGPRACVGQRFAMSQIKMGVAAIVLNVEIRRIQRTEVPVRYNPKAFLRVSEKGLWLSFKPLTR